MEKLAVLLPGLGAVSSTFIAGVEWIRRGRGLPIGSVTQLGRLDGMRIAELLPVSPLSSLVFGAWDIVDEDAAQVSERSRVLDREQLKELRSFLQEIRPRPGIHDPKSVRRIEANHVAPAENHRERVNAIREDIRAFKRGLEADRAVMVFCGSTETYREGSLSFESLRAFERGIDASDPALAPTVLYAYAALMEDVPFVNATPNRSVDVPAIQELALARGLAIAGKDLKTGQTLLKTAIAPALKARALGLKGWYSTNILGNRDGEVLDDPDAFRSKEITKTGVLHSLLDGDLYPELYGDMHHRVSIHYYPPRGDDKEGWDNIDLFGWLGYSMQLKINFLCRDSILAAPVVLDLVLLMDLAQRQGRAGLQEWLGFYFKSPTVPRKARVEHDLFVQREQLDDALRSFARGAFDSAVAPIPFG